MYVGRKEEHKGKNSYISSMTRGSPRSSMPSRGTIKRKIVELLSVNKKEGITSIVNPERLVLKFRDTEKVWGISNEIFPLVITVAIDNFEIS